MNVSRLSLAVIFSMILFSGTTSVAFAGVGPILGDFKCYLPDPDLIEPPTVPVANVGLEDQFRTLDDVDVFDRELICGNVIKDDGPTPQFPEQHYWTYDIVVNDIVPTVCVNVLLEDQFGTSTHTVCEPEELWVPAEKDNLRDDSPPFPIVKETHYLCYPLTGDSIDVVVNTSDQFADELVEVLAPTYLCNPVLKTTADGSVFGDQIAEHLKCYDIQNNIVTEQTKRSEADIDIILSDQFSDPFGDPPPFSDAVTSDTMEKLCVIVEKTVLDVPPPPDPRDPPVGGVSLPIDSTSLVLAGLQSNAIWMLPVLVGAAGIGAYYIKTRMNKDN